MGVCGACGGESGGAEDVCDGWGRGKVCDDWCVRLDLREAVMDALTLVRVPRLCEWVGVMDQLFE